MHYLEKLWWILKRIGAVLICAFLVNACGKSPGCWGEDKNEGLIEEYMGALICFEPSESGTVITSDSALNEKFDTNYCHLPKIDFNKYTLLGLVTRGGCAMKVKRKVIKDDGRKEYFYKIRAKDCGLCKTLVMDYNWVKVPKLPQGWIVRFELEEK